MCDSTKYEIGHRRSKSFLNLHLTSIPVLHMAVWGVLESDWWTTSNSTCTPLQSEGVLYSAWQYLQGFAESGKEPRVCCCINCGMYPCLPFCVMVVYWGKQLLPLPSNVAFPIWKSVHLSVAKILQNPVHVVALLSSYPYSWANWVLSQHIMHSNWSRDNIQLQRFIHPE